MPERRVVLSEDTDLAGTDIQSIFDTTIENCEMACLAEPEVPGDDLQFAGQFLFPEVRCQ